MRKKSWKTLNKSFQERNSIRHNSRGSGSATNYCSYFVDGGESRALDNWSPSMASSDISNYSSRGGGKEDGSFAETSPGLGLDGGRGRIKMSTSVNYTHQKLRGTTLLNSKVNVLVQILAILLLLTTTFSHVHGIKPSK